MRFSQRKGYTPVRVDVQRESMDRALRNKLWTAIKVGVFSEDVAGLDRADLTVRMWIDFFNEPIDRLPKGDVESHLRHWFFNMPWYAPYDAIEFIADHLESTALEKFTRYVNHFLEQEMAAYRLVNGAIAEITSQEEIQAVEEAVRDTGPFTGVQTHLRDALDKLTNRENPDFRNSIKESISAVEAMSRALTGDPKATLGEALKRLKGSGVHLHPAQEKAWLVLYGYTNDAHGIRHALSDEPNVTFSDAKYMLVTCSAFVNHLVDLSQRAGIQPNPVQSP